METARSPCKYKAKYENRVLLLFYLRVTGISFALLIIKKLSIMQQSLRISGYCDYIALDFTDKKGNIEKTLFYIRNGRSVEVHWPTPSSERMQHARTYDEFNDKYLFKMVEGKLFVRWLNGPCWFMETFTEVDPQELTDWRFQFATKIIEIPKN